MSLLSDPVHDLGMAVADVLDQLMVGMLGHEYVVVEGADVLSTHLTLEDARRRRAQEILRRIDDLRSREVKPLLRVEG